MTRLDEETVTDQALQSQNDISLKRLPVASEGALQAVLGSSDSLSFVRLPPSGCTNRRNASRSFWNDATVSGDYTTTMS